MKKPAQQHVSDPDNVTEIFCDGPFNVSFGSGIATLTFTHTRTEPEALFAGDTTKGRKVVRARVVTPYPNLVALRDLLNDIIRDDAAPATATSSPTKH